MRHLISLNLNLDILFALAIEKLFELGLQRAVKFPVKLRNFGNFPILKLYGNSLKFWGNLCKLYHMQT